MAVRKNSIAEDVMAWLENDDGLKQNPETAKFKQYLTEMVEAKKRRMSVSSSDSGDDGGHSSAAKSTVNTARYKTEMCRSFAENGYCRYGEKCQFAHGISELRATARHPRYKTEMCKAYHSTGFCAYGARCNFIHKDADTDQVQHSLPQQPVKTTKDTSISSRIPLGDVRIAPWDRPAFESTTAWTLSTVALGSTIDSPPQSVTESPAPSPSSMLFDSTFDAFPSLWSVFGGGSESSYAYSTSQ